MANDPPLVCGFSRIDSAGMPWLRSRFAPGVEVKHLGKADGRAMQLVRFAAGATFLLIAMQAPSSSTYLKARPCKTAGG